MRLSRRVVCSRWNMKMFFQIEFPSLRLSYSVEPVSQKSQTDYERFIALCGRRRWHIFSFLPGSGPNDADEMGQAHVRFVLAASGPSGALPPTSNFGLLDSSRVSHPCGLCCSQQNSGFLPATLPDRNWPSCWTAGTDQPDVSPRGRSPRVSS